MADVPSPGSTSATCRTSSSLSLSLNRPGAEVEGCRKSSSLSSLYVAVAAAATGRDRDRCFEPNVIKIIRNTFKKYNTVFISETKSLIDLHRNLQIL